MKYFNSSDGFNRPTNPPFCKRISCRSISSSLRGLSSCKRCPSFSRISWLRYKELNKSHDPFVRLGESTTLKRKYRDSSPVQLPKQKIKEIIIRTAEPVRYGIDRLDLVSKESVETLRKNLNIISPIPKKYGRLKILPISGERKKEKKYKNFGEAEREGFKSIFRIITPTEELFELLLSQPNLLGQYKPWYIEIFQDVILENEEEANKIVFDLIKKTYKKYSYVNVLYDREIEERQTKEPPPKGVTLYEYEQWCSKIRSRNRKKPNPNIFGRYTHYLGEDDFKFVTYARNSKGNGKPCLHREWRIMGENLSKKLKIRKKGTSYLDEIKNLSGLRCAKVFNDLTGKYIKYSNIDKMAVAKHRYHWQDKKKFTGNDRNKMQLYFTTFENSYDILTTSVLYSWCKQSSLDYRRFLKDIDLKLLDETPFV